MHAAVGSAAGSYKRVLLAPSCEVKNGDDRYFDPNWQPQRTHVHAPGPPLSRARVRPNSQPPRRWSSWATDPRVAHSPSFPLAEVCACASCSLFVAQQTACVNSSPQGTTEHREDSRLCRTGLNCQLTTSLPSLVESILPPTHQLPE